MGIIDIHSHFFSRPFFEALVSQAPGEVEGEQRLAELSAQAGFEVPPVQVAEHLARWVSDLDRHSVEHLCTFASAPEEIPATCTGGTSNPAFRSASFLEVLGKRHSVPGGSLTVLALA